MAYKDAQWLEAKTLFELGKSLADIERATGISRGAISKKSKKETWQKGKNQQLKSDIKAFDREKETLEAKKETLVEKVANLSDFEITMLNDVIEKESGAESLVFSTQSLAVIRQNQILTKGKKTVMLKVAQYGKGGSKTGEDFEPYQIDLSASDIKDCIDSVHKAGQTLGVVEQFAPKTEITNTNATQNNTKRVTIARRSDRRND